MYETGSHQIRLLFLAELEPGGEESFAPRTRPRPLPPSGDTKAHPYYIMMMLIPTKPGECRKQGEEEEGGLRVCLIISIQRASLPTRRRGGKEDRNCGSLLHPGVIGWDVGAGRDSASKTVKKDFFKGSYWMIYFVATAGTFNVGTSF